MNDNIIVTTGDLKSDYDIIGPVYFQVSNKGIFSSALSKLTKHYSTEIAEAKNKVKSEPTVLTGVSCMENSALGKATSRRHSFLPCRNSRSAPPS